MNSDTPKYYMPYDSGGDTDDGTDAGTDAGTDVGTDAGTDSEYYDSDNLPDSEDVRIRREEDPRYAIIRAAGPNLDTSVQQLKYMEHAPGSHYDNSTNITSLDNLVYLNPAKTTMTSLFSIKSSNRDIRSFSSPFNFQLKTPRVYKNVTKFQLVQISFPNNTQGFINTPQFADNLEQLLLEKGVPEYCLSTCVKLSGCSPATVSHGIVEQGRLNDFGQPMMTTVSIPTGFYSNQQLAQEFTKSANNTPPFNLISFEDFKTEFKIHRDISILFNEPGEYLKTNIVNPIRPITTKSDIINVYYTETHLDQIPVITDKIAFNAYYYPVLKELCAASVLKPFLNTGAYHISYVKTLILGQFLGLDSDIYYNLCLDNRGVLDEFRKLFTFQLRHINKYIYSYNDTYKQFRCDHTSLHTSIQRDINNKYNSILNHAISVKNLTPKSFQVLKNTYSQNNTIFKEMESYLSTQLGAMCIGDAFQYQGGLEYCGSHISTLSALSSFNNIFIQTPTFGEQFHGNYHGTTFNFNGFLSYHSTLSSLYNIVQNAHGTISSIHDYTKGRHHEYISTKYNHVLPHYLINASTYHDCRGVPVAFQTNQFLHTPGEKVKNRYLAAESLSVVPLSALSEYALGDEDPCVDACCAAFENLIKTWYSCLPTNVVTQFPEYRLGINNFNFSNFNAISTIFNVTSTSNFNIYLQINQFQSFNNMDIAMNENYTISNETTGQIKLMAAKILLQGVATGETSETAIQNPILFETPLGKLDKLDLKMYIDDGPLTPLWQWFPFELGINEWDATFQIDEEIGYADRNTGFSGYIPTVPIPTNPADFQYLALTNKNNPNNKS
jgi:hypothetical protein